MTSEFSKRSIQRRGKYKKKIDPSENRMKRQEFVVKLSKSKREQEFMKRRNFTEITIKKKDKNEKKLEQLPSFVEMVRSTDIRTAYRGLVKIRKLLSVEQNPPIQQVIDTQILPLIITFLDSNNEDFQFESCWILTNIASGSNDQTQFLVSLNVIDPLLQLLISPKDNIREQAIWALGNIAGDNINNRDQILNKGIIDYIIDLIKRAKNIEVIRNCTWCYANLCRGKPNPNFEIVMPMLPIIAPFITCNSEEVIADICWAISYLTDATQKEIQTILDLDIHQHFIPLLLNPNPKISTPALRIVGNIVTGSDEQTQAIIECNAIQYLGKLLNSSRFSIRKEACWAISNIAAGNYPQAKEVVDSGVLPQIINLCDQDQYDVKKETTWIISNIIYIGGDEEMENLINIGCIPPLCNILDYDDTKILSISLEALEKLLKFGEKKSSQTGENYNLVALLIEQANGASKIDRLQRHPNEDIYLVASYIIHNYFAEQDNLDEVVDPNLENQDVQDREIKNYYDL
ncbi:importin subunit alpha-4 [Anaeramoeba ignava]|uniref:Importin subunit alpha n=1 Tax=Anaeramoeba ignava TaxID=1746090 RepID=A0A9Q0LNG1_ANAIG|nr:importin subunit alpha-4 [Anaeramoeba ignava]